MSATMNEIALFLTKPLPLGLMLVGFFIVLAVFSLILARVESKHRTAQAQYEAQLMAMQRGGAPAWADVPSVAPLYQQRSNSSWFGWLMALTVVGTAGVALYVTQKPSAPTLVTPQLSNIPAVTPEPASSAAMIKKSAVAGALPGSMAGSMAGSAANKAPTLQAQAPAQAQAAAPKVDQARAAQASRRALAAPDRRPAAGSNARAREEQDIERLLAWERKRAEQRRRLRQRNGSSSQPTQRQATRQAPVVTEPAPRPRRVEERPAASPERAAPVQEPQTPKAAEPELLPEVKLPKKRRRRLKLDRSGDPLGSI